MINKNIIKGGIFVSIVAIGGFAYFEYEKYYPNTDDGYVNANLVYVAPKVGGYVAEINVKNNQFVHKGDVLFKIETTDYSVQLAQETQALKYAQQQLAVAKTQVSTANANVTSAKANYDYLNSQVVRYSEMVKHDAAAKQELENYKSQLASAKSQYEQAQNVQKQDVTQVEAALAQVGQAQAGVDNAQNQVGYTDVLSSVDGYVSNMYLSKGQFVGVGQQVFGLIDNNSWWIDANFKEDDLERVKDGQPVKISLDMYSKANYTGTVQSVSYASGTTFSLLPPQNATGNWVKVTQRFTIRVKVDNNPKFPLRVGASAYVVIDTTK